MAEHYDIKAGGDQEELAALRARAHELLRFPKDAQRHHFFGEHSPIIEHRGVYVRTRLSVSGLEVVRIADVWTGPRGLGPGIIARIPNRFVRNTAELGRVIKDVDIMSQ